LVQLVQLVQLVELLHLVLILVRLVVQQEQRKAAQAGLLLALESLFLVAQAEMVDQQTHNLLIIKVLFRLGCQILVVV
jgi:hypothetical protein